jgi:hypothetical protein
MSKYQSLLKSGGGVADEQCKWSDKGFFGNSGLQTVGTGNTHDILSTYKTSVKNSNMNKLHSRLRNNLEDNIRINPF